MYEYSFLALGILATLITDGLTIARLVDLGSFDDPDFAYGILILVHSSQSMHIWWWRSEKKMTNLTFKYFFWHFWWLEFSFNVPVILSHFSSVLSYWLFMLWRIFLHGKMPKQMLMTINRNFDLYYRRKWSIMFLWISHEFLFRFDWSLRCFSMFVLFLLELLWLKITDEKNFPNGNWKFDTMPHNSVYI